MSAGDDEPVHLIEDETGDRFLVYATEKGLRLDIRYAGDTLWMTQAQIAQLFGVNVPKSPAHRQYSAEGELRPRQLFQKLKQFALRARGASSARSSTTASIW